MLIAIDFDGTIVEHRYPQIGKERPFATETIRRLIVDRHRIILWTLRKGRLLDEAVEWCRERGIEFYAINSSYPGEEIDGDTCRKIKYDIVTDDRNIGGLPDWGDIYNMIQRRITYQQYLIENITGTTLQKPSKKRWWQLSDKEK